MSFQIVLHIPVIPEPNLGDGLSVQDGEVGLLVDLVLFPVSREQVFGYHPGKGGIRESALYIRDYLLGGVQQLPHAGYLAKGGGFGLRQILKELVSRANLGMAHYYNLHPRTCGEAVFMDWSFEEIQGQIYGRVDVRLAAPLSPKEKKILKDWIRAQNMDGVFESFQSSCYGIS